MSQENGSPTSLERWITFISVASIISGTALIIISPQLPTKLLQDVFLGVGLALAPSGFIGILADWLIFGKLIEALRMSTSNLGAKTKSLASEVKSLSISTDFLKRSSDLGLEMIYPNRAAALRSFVSFMRDEAHRKDAKSKLIIVGSSIKGLLENVQDMPEIVKDAIENEDGQSDKDDTKNEAGLHILLTHPEYSQYRENQEDRPYGAIEDEIFDGIRKLESCIEADYPCPPGLRLSPIVRLYKGTPTCFMIIAGDRMLINPYPYEEEAYRSFCISVTKVEPSGSTTHTESTIYDQYMRAHFEKPWERNAIPYQHYWLEGPDPSKAWDRDSCYGDVFVVQDAGHFYLAVYLSGQRKAEVRGMPTSIPCASRNGESDFLVLPTSFSVRLFDFRLNEWRHLDQEDEIGLLNLHHERRRGKASGKVNGNLLNDYLWLGLFDPDKEIVNPNLFKDSSIEALKEQPLPLFYVKLVDKRVLQTSASNRSGKDEDQKD